RAGSTASADRGRQLLARTETGHLARLDLDLLAGLGVPADAGLPLGDRERAETNQSHPVASLQRLGDAVDERVERLAGGRLADPGRLGDLVDQLRLVRRPTSIMGEPGDRAESQ